MIYVMSDIHGNLKNFNSIMEQINLKESDTLYILGDVIDRYPDGIKILRKIMKMPNAKMLLGNHEYMMLNAIENDDEINASALELWYCNGGRCTHDCLIDIRKDIRKKYLIISVLCLLTLTLKWAVKNINWYMVFQKSITKKVI